MNTMRTEIQVSKSNPRQSRVLEMPLDADIAQGEVLLRVDAFAFTANNVTYAMFGDAMKYWQFYPTGDVAWGMIPVWGFATVVASGVDGLAAGERFYGYWPMATHVVVQPGQVKAGGFVDAAAHRAALPAVYNQYSRCSTDPGYRADMAGQQMILRPLFFTSFLIDDFLEDNALFGASRVVLSSASSKTAYGTAFCLSQRQLDALPDGDYEVCIDATLAAASRLRAIDAPHSHSRPSPRTSESDASTWSEATAAIGVTANAAATVIRPA